MYNSPYRGNVIEVLKILNDYRFRCRLIYLSNLRTLKLERVPASELKKFGWLANAAYCSKENKIYLAAEEQRKAEESINHELFHSSSTKRGKYSGIVWKGNGYNLTEGITEYFNLKSKNKKISTSGYQLEVFVVEFLIFIYGEKILEPYFENNGKKFFTQFRGNMGKIINIDFLLGLSAGNTNFQIHRLFYLCLTDRMSDTFKDDIDFLENLHLNDKIVGLIEYHINANWEKILQDFVTYGDIDIQNYQFNNLIKKGVYEKFVCEYQESQVDIFKQILGVLIEMAKECGLELSDIDKFVQESLFYKSDSFKELYTASVNEVFNIQTKKR